MNLISLPRIDEAAEKTLLDETPEVDYLNKPSAQERPYLPTDKIQGELGSRATQMNLPPILAKQEELKSLCNSINLFIAPEQYRNTPYAFLFPFSFGGYVKYIALFIASRHLFIYSLHFLGSSKVKHSTRLETSLERKPDIALGLTTTVSQLDQRHTICQSKNNGKTSAPGKLSSHMYLK